MSRNRNRCNCNRHRRWAPVFFLLCLGMAGCASAPKGVFIKDIQKTFPPRTLLSGRTGQPVLFEAVIEELSGMKIIYVGENHANPAHHAFQLRILEALFQRNLNLSVGMEIVDHTYQEILDLWSAGTLPEKAFLERTHWYANWRYDFNLYRDILNFIRDHRLPLYGLNIPFHLPAKISIGGIDSLHPEERRFLPRNIDTTHAAHRAYVEEIFNRHRIPGRENFEHFYLAQCVWEETMAERIAAHLNSQVMVVLAGNGHILKQYGIPERAFKRTRLPFKTIYLASAGTPVEVTFGDYLYITR